MAKKTGTFQIGDRVWVNFGGRRIRGVVSDNPQTAGLRSRYFYHVRIPAEPDEPLMTCQTEDELQLITPEELAAIHLEKPAILEALTSGLLVWMLQQNMVTNTHPHVWLCPDTYDNPTFTLKSEYGLMGGAEVPFGTLYEGRIILLAKVPEVATFLKSFNLTDEEADEVIRAVGTKPRLPRKSATAIEASLPQA